MNVARPGLPELTWRLLAVGALGVDGYVHARDASFYAAPRGGAVSQAALFFGETTITGLAALLLLVGWRVRALRRVSWVLAFLVGASALGAVLLYRYVDIGVLGPIPNMYEPTWSVPGKVLSAYAEAVAAAVSASGLVVDRCRWGARPGSHRRSPR